MSRFLAVCGLFCNILLLVSGGFIVNPGPKVTATRGHPVPLPKKWDKKETFYGIDPREFQLEVKGFQCLILRNALERYSDLIAKLRPNKMDQNGFYGFRRKSEWENSVHYQGTLPKLIVALENPCELYPKLGMDESYSLDIEDSQSTLTSASIWGILRGLETFSQLITTSAENRLFINATQILDEPMYSHRGLMLDTSRHYIRPETIKTILDGMSYNKLNVFHWHLVDDQSFPFVSGTFPELSEKGAYKPELVYTPDTVQEIIEFARMRGIRVVPEFDTPGHTRSWGLSHLELLTECFGQYKGLYGPMDPTKNETYTFIRLLFREVKATFYDDFFHLGADEVDFDCWRSNAKVTAYMAQKGYGKDFGKLQDEFVGQVVAMINSMDGTPVVWEEAFNENLAKNAIVHVWKRDDPMGVMRKVTGAGHNALLSTGWYLDRLINQSDAPDYLKNDPRGFNGTEEQKALVLGGEACMWSELVDDDNVLPRIFSRVAAAAERLWSHDFSNLGYALSRLEEHSCRLKLRGIPTQPPNGPGFC